MERGQRVGRYRIDGVIGVGGMGQVLRAHVEAAGVASKPIALKVVRQDLAGQPSFARLFVEEVRVAMALSHANVVQAFDVGTLDGRWFLAMELVDGLDLSALLARRRARSLGPMPLGEALFVAVEALKGLDYAHRRTGDDGAPLGIVHRDVSPGNLLLSREGEVKVADFGVAKSALRDVGSLAGTLKGKIPYMPPEQLRGAAVDRRVDVYAACAVLYEMAVGRRLFDGDGMEAIPRIVAGAGPALARLDETLPRELVRILRRGLAPDPTARHPTAALLRQEIERLALDERVLLSSADLAAAVEDALSVRAEDLPPLTADDSTITDVPGDDDAFGALLGRALEKLGGEEPYSVYRTVVDSGEGA